MFDVGELLIVMFSKYVCVNLKASASRNVIDAVTLSFEHPFCKDSVKIKFVKKL